MNEYEFLDIVNKSNNSTYRKLFKQDWPEIQKHINYIKSLASRISQIDGAIEARIEIHPLELINKKGKHWQYRWNVEIDIWIYMYSYLVLRWSLQSQEGNKGMAEGVISSWSDSNDDVPPEEYELFYGLIRENIDGNYLLSSDDYCFEQVFRHVLHTYRDEF